MRKSAQIRRALDSARTIYEACDLVERFNLSNEEEHAIITAWSRRQSIKMKDVRHNEFTPKY
jgi:hypothetical protein